MSKLSSVRQELSDLWAGGKGKSLIVIALGWGLLIGTRMIYPPLIPYISNDFGFTLTTAGFLVAVVWITHSIGQVPGGILADRYSERRILMVSVTITACGVITVLVAPSMFVLFIATALVGAGLSQYPVARMTILSDLYPTRLGRALGVTMASGDVGQTALPPIASFLAAAVCWRLGFSYVLPFFFLTVVSLWWVLPKSDSEDGGSKNVNKSTFSIIAELYSPTIAIMCVMLFLFLFVWQTFSAFYPIYLTDEKGLSPTIAGILFGLFFAVGIVIKPLTGAAYDRVGVRRSLPVVLSGSIIGFMLLPFTDSIVGLVGVTILISTIQGNGAIVQPYLTETLPNDIQGIGLGLVRSGTGLLGATGPLIFGAIAEGGHYDAGYIILAILVTVISGLALRIPDA
ncbi:MFS transporter [Halopenitus persicus]|uniref:MFS transporter n=1 Tax=Halopenitus persicus TaxID=1048396 RepID=UPI000BBB28BC|nr:MFS transporter [Halopenitus persicus]